MVQPGGGATISANHSVTVVIQANDNVAGVLGITPLSLVTEEGNWGLAVNFVGKMWKKSLKNKTTLFVDLCDSFKIPQSFHMYSFGMKGDNLRFLIE